MTVIATVIAHCCTVHASDSLITTSAGGVRTELSHETKVARIPEIKGAVSFWGAAEIANCSTPEWVSEQAQLSPAREPGAIGRHLAAELTSALQPGQGIGLHLTAYEHVGGVWVPELFLVTNFLSPEYDALDPSGVTCSRQTYTHVFGASARDGVSATPRNRLRVAEFLADGRFLTFNNGDPVMFNQAAQGLFTLLQEGARRGYLGCWNEMETYRDLTRMPVETVAHVQRQFFREGTRLVDAPVHDLVVTPEGKYFSESGD